MVQRWCRLLIEASDHEVPLRRKMSQSRFVQSVVGGHRLSGLLHLTPSPSSQDAVTSQAFPLRPLSFNLSSHLLPARFLLSRQSGSPFFSSLLQTCLLMPPSLFCVRQPDESEQEARCLCRERASWSHKEALIFFLHNQHSLCSPLPSPLAPVAL